MNAARCLQKLRDGLAMQLEAVEELIAAPDPDEWIDQYASPLGTRKHCRLAKAGRLPGARKVGRQWLVRRQHLDTYITSQEVAKGEAAEEAQVLAFKAPSRNRKAR